MCGIAGIVNTDRRPIAPVLLTRMIDALEHRGPDGEGLFAEGSVGLGHKRLSIIDLSAAAHQPMQTVDGRYVISYNGEVYNFQDLRLELEAKGHTFRSRSDSEVVLCAFAEWGPAVLERLNGQFAFAIWDRHDHKLTVARDRFGIKPLYYMAGNGTFLFASEIKAFLALPDFSVELDKRTVLEYFTFQNIFTDRTWFAGVRMLPAGTSLTLTLSGTGTPVIERYWDFDFREMDGTTSEQEYLDELDVLLQQAINRQLVSDVPVSTYLSGGMDSGSIAAIATRQLPHLQSFTVGFDMSSVSGLELAFDERQDAERMSYLFGTEHYEMVLKAGDMERCLPDLIWHLEDPRVGQSYPNYYAARLAGKFGKVVLSGAGGDEMFGGYPWRYYQAVVNENFEHYVDNYYRFWQRLMPDESVEPMFEPMRADIDGVSTRDIFRDVFANRQTNTACAEDYVNESLYFEAKTFLHGLLVVEDKLGMAHGLETRVPYLDNDLVDFAMRLPVRHKLGRLGSVVQRNENDPGPKTRQYFARTGDGKLLLRKAMRRHMPEEITERQKQGFSAPDATWYRGESIEYVRRELMGNDALIYDFVDRSTVHELISHHLEGRENRRLLIWSLLCFENWCRIFLNGNRPPARAA